MENQIPLIVDRRGTVLTLTFNNISKKNALNSIEDEILKEVSLNKGWFLYSDFYVKEMAKIINETINGRKSPMEYSDLQDILQKPKDLVTRKLIFNN